MKNNQPVNTAVEPKTIVVSFYLRPEDVAHLSNLPAMMEEDAAPAKEYGQPLSVIDGFNFVNFRLFDGLKIQSYKLVKRGSRLFLSLTFTNQVKRNKAGYAPYRQLAFALIIANLWETKVYINKKAIAIACREKKNMFDKELNQRPVKPVVLP